MIAFIITALVTAVSLFLLSKLPIGVEVDNFKIAAIAGIVFGVLNAFVAPVIGAIVGIGNVLTLGLLHGVFSLITNTILFGLAAWLVSGFRLAKGWLSALLGAIGLTFVNSILFKLLALVSG
jgi:putative membrane protein